MSICIAHFNSMQTVTCSLHLAKMMEKGREGGTVRRGMQAGLWEKRSGDGGEEVDE